MTDDQTPPSSAVSTSPAVLDRDRPESLPVDQPANPSSGTSPVSGATGFYATDPHQPTYRPPPPPACLLDLLPPPTRDSEGRQGGVEHGGGWEGGGEHGGGWEGGGQQGGGWEGGSWERDEADRRARPLVALAGLAVLLLLAAGTVAAASLLHQTTGVNAARPSASTPAAIRPRSPGQVVAATIDAAIIRSIAARELIGPANARTRACRATTGDVTALTSAATTRTKLVTGLGDVNVRELAGGSAVVADLRQAWTYSARADLAYAAWARHQLRCSGHAATKGNADWERAHHNDTLSSAAKARAVERWNPLARRYHLAVRSAVTI